MNIRLKKSIQLLALNLSLTLITAASAFAQDGAAPAGTPVGTTPGAAPNAPGTFEMIIPFIGMFAIMYFLMIRPQQKRAKEQAAMLNTLKTGDEVLTTSGMLGKVDTVSDKIVTLEIDRSVKVRMMKSQIAQVMPPNASV